MNLITRIRNAEKFKKSDIVIIIIFSLIVSASSLGVYYISESSVFFSVEHSSRWLQISGFILGFPGLIMMYAFHLGGIDTNGGDDLASYLWGIFASPFLAFIFWFVVFYILAKTCSKISKRKGMIAKHSASLLVIILILFPYALYFFNTSTDMVADQCLSGELNYQMMSGSFGNTAPKEFTVGPDYCFGDIAKAKNLSTAQQQIDFCQGLSDTKVVGDQGKGGGIYNFPKGLSFRDYCLYSLAPLDAGPLCSLVGADDTAKVLQCTSYFDGKKEQGNLENFYPKADLPIFDTIRNATAKDRIIFEVVNQSDVDASTTKQIKFAESPITRDIFPNDYPITVARIEKVFFSPADTYSVSGTESEEQGTLDITQQPIVFEPASEMVLTSVNGKTASNYFGVKVPNIQPDLISFDFTAEGSGNWQMSAFTSHENEVYSLVNWMNLPRVKTSLILPIPDHQPYMQFAMYGFGQTTDTLTVSHVHFAKSSAFQINGARFVGYRVTYSVKDPSKASPDMYVYYVDQTGFKYAY